MERTCLKILILLVSSSPLDLQSFKASFISEQTMELNGTELWATDGTSEGTMLVEDIMPGTYSSAPVEFTVLGDKLIFGAREDLLDKRALGIVL